MAHQLIYTSVPSGLVAGRSGFCTAARHKEIKEGLVSRIENISAVYDRDSRVGGRSGELPVIFSHRIVDIRGTKSHLLMRVADAGSDYTGRTNHIAHSIVIDPAEVSGLKISPAEAILHITKENLWQHRYEGAAKFFGPEAEIDFAAVAPLVELPASRWKSVTGAAANAAWLVDAKAGTGAGIVAAARDENDELLHLFAESLLIVGSSRKNPHAMWERSFTTRLQGSENRTDFDWYGCAHNSPAHMQGVKANRFIIELAPGMAPPQGPKADIAEGKEVGGDEPEAMISIPLSPQEADDPGILAPAKIPQGEATIQQQAPASIMPQSASLSGESSSKKKGIPTGLKVGIGFLLVVLPCIGFLLFTLFGGGERKELENQISEAVTSGNWNVAENILKNKISADDRATYRSESGDFKKLEKTVELARLYTEVVKTPEKIAIENKDKAGTLGNYLAQIEESAGVQPGSTPALATLHQNAHKAAKEYDTTISTLNDLWKMIKAAKPWVKKFKNLRKNFQSLSYPSDGPTMRQIADLEEIAGIEEDFALLKTESHKSGESSDGAKKNADNLAQILYAKVDSSDPGLWKDAINRLYGEIGRFQPKIDLPPARPKKEEMAEKTTEKKDEKDKPAVTLAAIPPTYVWGIDVKHEYDYSGIQEMEEEFPPHYTLLAVNQIPPGPLEFGANLIGNKIYFDGGVSKEVMEVDEKKKTLKGNENFKKQFGSGFYFGFGDAKAKTPNFQIIGQQATPYTNRESAKDHPYMMDVSVSDFVVLSQETVAAKLTPQGVALLDQIKVQPGISAYEFALEMKEGSAFLRSESTDSKSLAIAVVAETERGISNIAERIQTLENAKVAEDKFTEVFSDAGKKLLMDGNGKILWEGLRYEVEEVKNGRPVSHRIVPNKAEATPMETEDIKKTLEEYENTRTIVGDSFIDYVNSYIFGDLRLRVSKSDAWKFVQDDIKDHTYQVTKHPQKTEDPAAYRAAAIAGWRKVSALSAEHKWATKPKISDPVILGTDPGEVESKIRRKEPGYSADRYLSDFFRRWDALFTPENLAILNTYMMSVSSLPGDVTAEIDFLKAQAKALEDQKKTWQEKPLSEWGTFYVNAIVEGEATASGPGKKEVFRLLKSK